MRITATWTLYRPYSGENHTPYVAAWWDDDFDTQNDSGLDEDRINFNSAIDVVSLNQQQWIQDLDTAGDPITPQGRYLILRSPAAMTNRASEYAIVGWIQ